jgi:hypothetical protein
MPMTKAEMKLPVIVALRRAETELSRVVQEHDDPELRQVIAKLNEIILQIQMPL